MFQFYGREAGTDIEQILVEDQCDKGVKEQNFGGANVTKVPITDQIDKSILKKE